MQTKYVDIPKYIFQDDTNPFSFDANPRLSVEAIASMIVTAIHDVVGQETVLVRGVQSGHHHVSREELISKIRQKGSDLYEVDSNRETIYAAIFEPNTIKEILEGFHTYKPKCEEKPQYPVDVWLIYDAKVYKNVAYMHPRHKVLANDKWMRKDNSKSGLLAIIIVN